MIVERNIKKYRGPDQISKNIDTYTETETEIMRNTKLKMEKILRKIKMVEVMGKRKEQTKQ